jgi:dihydrofolate reductase
MAKLIYSTIASLDLFVEDIDGRFDWGVPDEELFARINDLERPIGTYLYGRRMYETMVYWETFDEADDQTAVEKDFTQIWKAADKIVFSTTLLTPLSERTSIESEFIPDSVRQLKKRATHDITVAGAELASQMLRAGLVDEIQLFLVPLILGTGKRALPTHEQVPLELVEERRFASGTLYLRYAVIH